MAERVVVFMDWQNVYRRGRDAFGLAEGPHTDGQVDPVALAHRLAARKPGRELVQVRVYRGLPVNKEDPKGYAANRRQTAAWMKTGNGRLQVFLRSLKYQPGFRPREKGIDVHLAVDFVAMAVRDEYDVGILFSSDSDLEPALEAVAGLPLTADGRRPTHEVAAWRGAFRPPQRIGGGGTHPAWCHWLTKGDFDAVADRTDYGRS
jgi:uncharacterized LabA/DUF88 family protein